jgi:ABC-type proline/glycine betaine transport system ATPase subunit
MNPVVRGDIVVSAFLDSIGGYRHKERRDKLLDILDIDPDWHMHAISDGERRRVQLCMGLMAPWDVLLLDEVGSFSFRIPELIPITRSRLIWMFWFAMSCSHSFETTVLRVERPSFVCVDCPPRTTSLPP